MGSKKIVLLSAALLLALHLPGAGAFAQERFERRFPTARDGTIKIGNTAGSVTVIGWDRDSVVATGTLGVGATGLEASSNGREAGIRVEIDREARDIGTTELEVRVPRYTQVAIRTSTADITVSDVGGGLDLETVSGTIRVSGTPRMVYAESVGGDVILDVSTKVARAKSIEGDVSVSLARGYVEISTVSGTAHLAGAGIWEGEVSTVSGDIVFEGSLLDEGSLRIESHGGRIELNLPDGSDADFDITTLAGAEVRNDFGSNDERRFSIGRGGSLVRVKSFKGRVEIRKKN